MSKDERDAASAENSPEKLSLLPQKRLEKLLKRLDEEGSSQADVAKRLDVTAAYLSDVKNGRRPLSELFARKFFDEYGVDHLWLLGQHGSMTVPPRNGTPTDGDSRRVWLPVFVHPIAGDPARVPNGDGTRVELAGAAATRALFAEQPYVLRFEAKDRQGRLQRGDLVLISQAVNEKAAIHVLKAGNKMFLARRDAAGAWQRLSVDAKIVGEPVVMGHCVGVVWSVL
jgi:hypothetical protein